MLQTEQFLPYHLDVLFEREHLIIKTNRDMDVADGLFDPVEIRPNAFHHFRLRMLQQFFLDSAQFTVPAVILRPVGQV